MKKLMLSMLVAFGMSISANAQSSGDLFAGGASNLGVAITPDFNLNASINADYFIMDGLSVGGNVGLGIGSVTSISLAPSVRYFFMDDIFAMVSADVLSIVGDNTSAGLNSLNAGVGYWYALRENVIVAPMLNLSDITNSLGINLGMGISVKL